MTSLSHSIANDLLGGTVHIAQNGSSPPNDLSLGKALARQISIGAVRGPVRRIPAGSHLYRMGEAPHWICLIRQGWAKSLSASRQGKLCVLGIEGPGSVLGAVKDPAGSRGEDIVTKTDVTFHVIPRADFERCLASPVFNAPWHGHVLNLMSERQRMLVSFVTLDSEHRLAATLLHLAEKWGAPDNGALRLLCSLTHEELGQMVGTTRSRVGYFINQFQARGLVRKSRDGMAVHPDRLQQYAWA
jgi:CRP/FNR family transcriptional regulator, cyclic AMP receptor protein